MKIAVIVGWLTAELLKIPGSHAPGETREDYQARVQAVSTALVEEARTLANGSGWSLTELAAAGGIIWHGESLFDKRVHAGEPHPLWNEDHHLARCGMQIHSSGIVPQDVWEKLVGLGTDETHLCAQYGLRVLIAQAKQCGVFLGQRADRRRVAMTFASYASGGKCKPTDREWERADRWLKVMATRPDNERATHPGFRRAGPAEIPPTVREYARGLVSMMGPEWPAENRVKVGDALTDHDGRWKYVVEKHADGKVGVSVLVKE
jgi:hypothetical protein